MAIKSYAAELVTPMISKVSRQKARVGCYLAKGYKVEIMRLHSSVYTGRTSRPYPIAYFHSSNNKEELLQLLHVHCPRDQ